MALKITFSLIVGILAVATSIHGQELNSRFIVELGHFRQPYLNETIIQCAGTLISERHILCTASCVIVQAPTEIAINAVRVTLVPEGGNYSESTLVPAAGVLIHPFYENSPSTNNAAIVTTTIFRSNPNWGFVPRSLGSLSTTTACNLFGWGGGLLNPRRDAVMVNGPANCNPNNPQNFCSIFDSIDHASCSAKQGSPLTCGNDMTVAGFVTNAGGCTPNDGRTTLNYHSISHFSDWINGVTQERDAVNFVVTVMDVFMHGLPLCFGTIISSNRVLTTATCATYESESPFELEVQTRIVHPQDHWSESRQMRISEIFIHPNYNRQNVFENNVAVIQVFGTFDQIIVPRTLGNLQQNNSCQLFGWGPTDIGFTRGDAITVNVPQSCDPNHPQAFCTSHPSMFHYSCSARTGSPVTCGDNEAVVTGFLINNGTCNSNDNSVSLSYHSVGQFTGWILNPSNAAVNKVSSVFFLFIVLKSLV